MIQRPSDRRISSTAATRWALMAFMGWMLAVVPQVWAASATSKEYQVKAAFLLNFAQFIRWPSAAFSTAESPITIGVLGEDPFGTVLEQTFQDESIDGRKLVVKRSRRMEDLKGCHMLFVGAAEKDRVPEIMKAVQDASVVTIGETDQFAERGGIINFYVDGGKIHFEINADAAQQKGLKINSQLLKRAKIITPGAGKGQG